MTTPFDVCILGAGVVGRTLALLLARDGLRIGLVESPPSGPADVRAYAMSAASRDLLASLRAWPDDAGATPVLRMDVRGDASGRVQFDAHDLGVPALAWIADAPALQEQLAQALRYQPRVELLAEAQPAQLTVICEGKASAARAGRGVHYDVTPYSQQAIAARLTCEQPHGQVARQWFARGEVMALLPRGGPAGHEAALVWSVSPDRASRLMNLSPAQFTDHLTDASQACLGRLSLAGDRARWPLQLATASRWCGPGWALAGDAAHTVHPLAGQGLNLGLADVKELAAVLHARDYWRSVGDERLLRRYERARKARVATMQLATDGIQQLFAQNAPAWSWLRNWGMWGFEHSGPLKQWAARHAAGQA